MRKSIIKVKVLITVYLLFVMLEGSTLFAEDPEIVKITFTDAPTLNIGEMVIYHPSYAAMLAFKGAFEKYTSGRYKVELYPYGSLGDAASNLEQILSGTLQGATPADGAVAPFYKNIQVLSIPYLFDTPLTAYDVLDGSFGAKLFDDMAKTTGFRVISAYDNGGYRNFSTSKNAIKTAEDMDNLKIRTMDISSHMEIVKALGASPTPVAFLELYSALQTGVVDGQENSAITMLGASLQEVQSHVVTDGHLLGIAFLVVGEDWFQSLSAEDKGACLKAGREAAIAARGTVRYAESLALDTLRSEGVNVYSPTSEELETFKVAQEPVIEWLRENIDASLVDELLDLVNSGKVGTPISPMVNASATSGTTADIDGDNASPSTSKSSTGNMILYIVIAVLGLIIIFMIFKNKKKPVEK